MLSDSGPGRLLPAPARPSPARPGPALATSAGLARGWPAALWAKSRAGGTEARRQGASLLGVTGGRSGGPGLGEWGWTGGLSPAASSSAVHRFTAVGHALRFLPVTARPGTTSTPLRYDPFGATLDLSEPSLSPPGTGRWWLGRLQEMLAPSALARLAEGAMASLRASVM